MTTATLNVDPTELPTIGGISVFPLFGGEAFGGQMGTISTVDVLVSHTADGVPISTIWEELISVFEIWNKERTDISSLLSFRTTVPVRLCRKISRLLTCKNSPSTASPMRPELRQGEDSRPGANIIAKHSFIPSKKAPPYLRPDNIVGERSRGSSTGSSALALTVQPGWLKVPSFQPVT
jgi:hypothetical protein